MVTGAAASPDGRYLAVLTYLRLYVFERPSDSDDYLSQPVKTIEFDTDVTQQCEGVTWDEGHIYFTNEQAEIHRIDGPLSREVTHYPAKP